MKKISTLSGPAALLIALCAAGTALSSQAAPEAKPGQPPHEQLRPGAFPFPPPAPLYEASLQTRQPDEALTKLIANAPKGDGKNYEVKVLVRELPPEPPHPEAANADAKPQ